MRLIEEKRLIKIEVILLVFVFFTGIGIQICSNLIDNYNFKILKFTSALNLTENERLGQRIQSINYLLSAFANADIDVDFKKVNEDQSLDGGLKNIVRQYELGEITKNEYFNKLSVRHGDISYNMYLKYLSQKQELKNVLSDKPVWIGVRYILFSLQLTAILASIIMYIFIYRSIDNRTKEK